MADRRAPGSSPPAFQCGSQVSATSLAPQEDRLASVSGMMITRAMDERLRLHHEKSEIDEVPFPPVDPAKDLTRRLRDVPG